MHLLLITLYLPHICIIFQTISHRLHAAVVEEYDQMAASSHDNIHPSLSVTQQTLVLEDIHNMMACYQRAAVLAHRGGHWTLIQNVARSLWNAMNSIILATSKFTRQVRGLNMAGLNGLACKPLYFLADGLIDMLYECGTKYIPQTSSLKFTPSLDDVNEMGMTVVRQNVFLAIHTLYIHRHWEKVITLCLHFDDVTK